MRIRQPSLRRNFLKNIDLVAKLTTKQRKKIPAKDFAGKGRSFPINNRSHAVNALARASGKPVEAQVRAKVHAKYPDLGGRVGLINRS